MPLLLMLLLMPLLSPMLLSLMLSLSYDVDVVDAVVVADVIVVDYVVVIDRLAAVDMLPLPHVLTSVPHHNTVLGSVCGRLVTDPTRIVAVRASISPHPGAL